MKLTHITPDSLIYLERYVDQKKYSRYAEFSAVSAQYQPASQTAHMQIPYITRPMEDIHLELANPSVEVAKFYVDNDNDTLQFPVHPEVFYDKRQKSTFLVDARAGKRLTPHVAQPTASTRTLLVEDAAVKHFVKLHLPRRISRFNRRLRNVGILNSILVSRDLQNMHFEARAGIMPETIGAWDTKTKWGFLVREMQISGHADVRTGSLVPLFALHSMDIHATNDLPLVIQLIDYHHADPLHFIVNEIIGPIVKSWAEVAQKTGILLAPHGQNALLNLDENFKPSGIVHRDFVALDVDAKLRKNMGLPIKFTKYVIPIHKPEYRQMRYSHIFDFQMGHHLFDFLAAPVVEHYGIDIGHIRQGVADILHDSFTNYDEYFPKSTFQYPDQAFPNNQSFLVASNSTPNWR